LKEITCMRRPDITIKIWLDRTGIETEYSDKTCVSAENRSFLENHTVEESSERFYDKFKEFLNDFRKEW